MKILLSGGLDKYVKPGSPEYFTTGYGNSSLVQHSKTLHEIIGTGGKVAIVTAAKPSNDHYNVHLTNEVGIDLRSVDVLGVNTVEMPDWGAYSAVILMGGETEQLLNWLIGKNFEVEKLNQCRLLLGDSAGAYVLGSKVLIYSDPKTGDFSVADGLLPASGMLVVGHTNNERYCSQLLLDNLKQYCSEQGCRLVPLAENQIIEQETFMDSNNEINIS